MKKTMLSALALSGALLTSLSACTASGPSNLRVHEALLYGGTQERVMWVYGELNGRANTNLKLGNTAATLRLQVTDPLALDGTLSVDGKATFRQPTSTLPQQLTVTRRGASTFTVNAASAAVQAVYYTDGTNWTKLNGISGTVTSSPVSGLAGTGSLTSAEAGALSTALLGQGSLAVALLDETAVPDGPLTIEPTPQEYLRTALYILPNVATVSLTTSGPTNPSVQPHPTTPGASVKFTELGSGSQANVTAFSVQQAFSQSAANALYAQAYGRQTGVPTAPTLSSGSTIVGVFLGQRPSGGYSVKVVNASVSGSVLTLVLRVTAPGPGTMTTQALTSPWTLVRVDGQYTQVRVVDERGQPITAPPSGGTVR